MAGAAHGRGALSRRSFLRDTALGTGLLAVSRLRPGFPPLGPAAPAAAAVHGAPLQVLDAGAAQVMTAVVERMVFSGDPGMPAVRDTGAIAAIDAALAQLEPSLRGQVLWLLRLVEWGPPLFALRLTTFTRMDDAARDAYLRGWATSRLGLRRLGFRALKNLSMLGYYSQDETWKVIGYDGPWVPRPRRVAGGACRGE